MTGLTNEVCLNLPTETIASASQCPQKLIESCKRLTLPPLSIVRRKGCTSSSRRRAEKSAKPVSLEPAAISPLRCLPASRLVQCGGVAHTVRHFCFGTQQRGAMLARLLSTSKATC